MSFNGQIYTARLYKITELGQLLIGELERTRTGTRPGQGDAQEEYAETTNIFASREEAEEVAANALANVPDAQGYIIESIPVVSHVSRESFMSKQQQEG